MKIPTLTPPPQPPPPPLPPTTSSSSSSSSSTLATSSSSASTPQPTQQPPPPAPRPTPPPPPPPPPSSVEHQLPQATVKAAHVTTLTTTAQSNIPMQTPVTTLVPTLTQVPITAHQQSTPITQAALITRPPQTLPVMPIITTTSTTQSPAVQMQAPVTTLVPTLTQVPITAHQQSKPLAQTALISWPPQTLPVVPITTAATITSVKQEPAKLTCCLLDTGIRCDRFSGNASFSARIKKIVEIKKMNFTLDPSARHTYICDHHKAIITVAKKSTSIAQQQQQQQQHQQQHQQQQQQQPYRGPPPEQFGSPMNPMMPGNFDSMGGDSIASSSVGVDVDLQQLQVNTLRRYKKHFKVQTPGGLNKSQLAESLKSHFRTLPIIEKEAITYFVYIVKCNRNKLDANPKAD